ncbi:hypothetical protein BC833DRAFT_610910 [Globomyces pollinis-pini]|nr:hypothetical protein BC833DRAFT_610910 [Globomyces pollinis-pini]
MSFDCRVYLNEDRETMTKFDTLVFKHRHKLYALFKHWVKDTQEASAEELKEFNEFLDIVTIDMKMSYSIFGLIFHGYLIYWSWKRVLYCPTGEWVCPTRPWTLVDQTGWIQALFYTILAIPIPKLQIFTFYHGSLIMQGCHFMTWWLVDSNTIWSLHGQTGFSTWNAIWIPLIYWNLFSFVMRQYFGLSHWMYNNNLEELKEELKESKVGKTEKTGLQIWILYIYTKLLQFEFLFIPILGTQLYWYFHTTVLDSPLMDVTSKPSYIFYIFTLIVSWFVNSFWYDFLTFQYQLIIWDEFWYEGLVVMSYDKEITVGFMY